MEGSRAHILKFLQQHNAATVDQLARHMGLASATVRRHLDILQRDHLVDFRQVKKKTGRPEYTYYLTEEGQESLPKDYDRLLGSLLWELSHLSQDEVGNYAGEDLLQLVFQQMAQRVVVSMEPYASDSFSARLERAMAILQQEHFQPEVEKMNGSVRIHLHNCPFRSVALGNRSVCAYDSVVLSALLGTEVVRERCIRETGTGCCYIASAVAEQSARFPLPPRLMAEPPAA